MENVIEIKNLNKKFKNKNALKNISFSISKGSFHGFIGNNGAGKTTTFRSILGFYPDVKGEIFINGISFKDYRSRQSIGYIPEVCIFPKHIKIKEYLYHFAEMSGLSSEKAKEKTQALLKHYHFDTPEFDKPASKLSSGQKKKVMLMQALVNDPEILILDEPAANLDPSARIELYENLKELHNQGKTIFLSSHILLELEKYIDSFTILKDGEVIESCSVEDKLKNDKYDKKIIIKDMSKLNDIKEDLLMQFPNLLIKNNELFIEKTNENIAGNVIGFLANKKIEIDEIKNIGLNFNQEYFSTLNNE